MDFIEQTSKWFCNDLMVRLKPELELVYVVYLVRCYAKASDREWHRNNIFLSYLRTVLYVCGTDILIALCTAQAPISAMADNNLLLLIAIVWWMTLFMPLDLFNKLMEVEVSKVKPFEVVLELLTSLRCVAAVNGGVEATLKGHPGSYVAILVGTLAGNGCLVVDSIFGAFAASISSPKATRRAFICAVIFTLVQIRKPSWISRCATHAVLACFFFITELLQSFGRPVQLFEPVYDIIRKVVDQHDLMR